MENKDFSPDTRYTITLRDASGRLRPANIYVFRLYDGFMIARMTDSDGLLRKINYMDITKIVKTVQVPKEDRFSIADAIVTEKAWAERTQMERYSSSPGTGK